MRRKMTHRESRDFFADIEPTWRCDPATGASTRLYKAVRITLTADLAEHDDDALTPAPVTAHMRTSDGVTEALGTWPSLAVAMFDIDVALRADDPGEPVI
jgi:hypothetical protein